MLYIQIAVNSILFFIGAAGMIINSRKNILLVLMSIEIMILSVDLNLATFSIYLSDSIGQIYFLLGLTVAAAESAIGLAILIAFYKNRKQISIADMANLRG